MVTNSSKWVSEDSIRWQTLPIQLQDWIRYRCSMTEKLKTFCHHRLRVNVLYHDWGSPTEEESIQLRLKHTDKALIREVLLICGDRPGMFARTVFSKKLVEKNQQVLLHLDEKPMGEWLFNQPSRQRSAFEMKAITKNDPDYIHISNYIDEPIPNRLWARRSLFYIQQEALLLTEYFLPVLLEECSLD